MGQGRSSAVPWIILMRYQLVDLHFNPTVASPAQSVVPTLSRSSSSSYSLASMADKRRSLLSIDGALDALKPREMWKGLKGVTASANSPGGDEVRKRGEPDTIHIVLKHPSKSRPPQRYTGGRILH